MNKDILVGIHKDPYGEFGPYIQRFEDICRLNHIPSIRLNASDYDFWDRLKNVTHFIYRWGHTDAYKYLAKTILPIIEGMEWVKVYPNQASCWHYDDKIKQFCLLKRDGFPVVNSYVFWDKESTLKWIGKTDYPFVFKLSGGAGAAAVLLVKDHLQAKSLVNRCFGPGMLPNAIGDSNSLYHQMSLTKKIKRKISSIKKTLQGRDGNPYWYVHKNYFYTQEFLPGNEWDTRVATIGKRADAFRRFVRKGDFRASGSHLWDTDKSEIDMRMISIAHQVSQFYGFQSMAYDFIYDKQGNPVIIEISYTYGEPDDPDFNAGYWDLDLIWHEGHFKTRELIMEDLLEIPNLRYP
jgi:hypothetical protein